MGVSVKRLVGMTVLAVAMVAADFALATPLVSESAIAGPPDAGAVPPRRLAEAWVPQTPRAKPKPPNVIEKNGARFAARLAAGAEPLGSGLSWRVIGLDDTSVVAESRYSRPAIELEPGRYRVSVEADLVAASAEFAVAPDQVTDVDLTLDAGRLIATIRSVSPAISLHQAALQIRPAGSPQAEPLLAESGERIETVLPAGRFELAARQGEALTTKEVTIEVGQTTEIEVVLKIGYLLANAYAAEGAEPLSDATYILAAGTARPGDDGEIARTTARHAVFSVSPGDYRLITRFGLAEVEEAVRIAENRLSRVAVTLDAARLELEAVGPPAPRSGDHPATFRIQAAASKSAFGSEPPLLIAEVEGNRPVLRLPAGRFVVEAERQGYIARETVELRAGESRRIRLALDAGRLALGAKIGANPADPSTVLVTALPLGDDGSPAEPAIDLGRLTDSPFSLPAGRYRIEGRLDPGAATAETEVEIRIGRLSEAGIDFDVGTARLEMVDKPDGAAVADTLWRIGTADERWLAKVFGSPVEVKLEPGAYEVSAAAGEKGANGRIVIEAGKIATLSLIAK